MKITILGCGPSVGVPDIVGDWGDCDALNPKNRRFRTSIFIEHQDTRVLVDAGPDLKAQFSFIDNKAVDGVIITHAHFDHIAGIGELRRISQIQKNVIPVYANNEAAEELLLRDKIFFESTSPLYPAIFSLNIVKPYTPFHIGAMEILPFSQNHGEIQSVGLRIGNFAYSTDFKTIPEESLSYLENLDLWIVESLKDTGDSHPTHTTLDETLALIKMLKPKHAVLVHMNNELDYDSLASKLPKNIKPAFDGMVLKL